MKRLFVVIFLLLTSCTAALWSVPEYKDEYLNGFYVNSEMHSLFVTTEQRGYLFPISKDLEEILLLSRTISFRPEFSDFKVNRNHDVTGRLTLILTEEKLSREKLSLLRQLGVRQDNSRGKSIYFSILLQGSQYVIDGDLPLVKLENQYKISIEQPESFANTARKIIATPVAITIDAVVVLPATFVLATFWILAESSS